jgi:hypothetical protein
VRREKGNRKAAAIFGVDESNVRLWRKHKAAISRCEASRRKLIGPKKGQFPETGDAVFTLFQERRKTGLFVSYALPRKEAIKKATSLNIGRWYAKSSQKILNKSCWIISGTSPTWGRWEIFWWGKLQCYITVHCLVIVVVSVRARKLQLVGLVIK